GMNHSVSSRVDARFSNGEVTKVTFITKHDDKYYPLLKIKEEDKILKGFIWKPNDRPASKESIINAGKSARPAKAGPKKTPATKPGAKGKSAKPAAKNA